MSETPQETLERYIRDGGIITLPHIREAIRAVLDLVRVQYEANEEMTRLLSESRLEWPEVAAANLVRAEAAEAEVGRLRAEGLAIADGQIADRERLEAERDEWRDTARNEMAGRAAVEAERARAEKFWASAQERAEKMEAERDALRDIISGGKIH